MVGGSGAHQGEGRKGQADDFINFSLSPNLNVGSDQDSNLKVS
jgi:hypothetical protein